MMENIEQMKERHKRELEVLKDECEHKLRIIKKCSLCGWRDDIIEDGFGSVWSAYCPECGRKSMAIVRPGKIQCNYCG